MFDFEDFENDLFLRSSDVTETPRELKVVVCSCLKDWVSVVEKVDVVDEKERVENRGHCEEVNRAAQLAGLPHDGWMKVRALWRASQHRLDKRDWSHIPEVPRDAQAQAAIDVPASVL